jgi:hypothetical protein
MLQSWHGQRPAAGRGGAGLGVPLNLTPLWESTVHALSGQWITNPPPVEEWSMALGTGERIHAHGSDYKRQQPKTGDIRAKQCGETIADARSTRHVRQKHDEEPPAATPVFAPWKLQRALSLRDLTHGISFAGAHGVSTVGRLWCGRSTPSCQGARSAVFSPRPEKNLSHAEASPRSPSQGRAALDAHGDEGRSSPRV